MNDEIFVKGCFKYTVEDGNARLCLYCGTEKAVAIPKILDGYTVTSIGNNTFTYCNNIRKVVIPNSVTSIEDEAFEICYSGSVEKLQFFNSFLKCIAMFEF